VDHTQRSTLACTAAFGTNAKCQPHRGMSEFGGEAENICSHRVFRILTHNGSLRFSKCRDDFRKIALAYMAIAI